MSDLFLKFTAAASACGGLVATISHDFGHAAGFALVVAASVALMRCCGENAHPLPQPGPTKHEIP